MHNIAIARRLRGITARALAEQLNVAYQQVGNWEQGIRNPSRSAAQEIAGALDVDVAWIMDCPQISQLRDPLSGDIISGHIMRTEDLPGYGLMQHLYLDEHDLIVAVIRSLDVVFTPSDWQGQQPLSAAEIADHAWMDGHGHDAVMIDGLPRVML